MGYSIENYDRPSVATDAVVFGIERISEKSKNTCRLKILLIKRGEDPYKNHFSLPGGFLRPSETVENAMHRELREETGISNMKLINFGTYSKPNRDPRGWILSCAFLALCNTASLLPETGSDAESAEWWNITYYANGKDETILLTDNSAATGIVLRYRNGKFEYNRSSHLAFDHADILYDGFMRLRDETTHHDIIFDLMPEKFTLADIQQPYEAITGRTTSPQAFRKRMSSKLIETDEYETEKQHRPAKLYKKG